MISFFFVHLNKYQTIQKHCGTAPTAPLGKKCSNSWPLQNVMQDYKMNEQDLGVEVVRVCLTEGGSSILGAFLYDPL